MEVAIERTLSIGSSEDRRIIASEDASKTVDDLHMWINKSSHDVQRSCCSSDRISAILPSTSGSRGLVLPCP